MSEAAIDAYVAYLELNTHDPSALMAAQLNLGDAYAAQGLFKGAERCYRAVLRRSPENAEARTRLNAVIEAQGKAVQAVPP